MTVARRAIALAVASSLCAGRAGAQDRERCVAAFDEGQAHRLRGELRSARALFVACAGDSCPTLLRKDCAQSLSDVDAELPTVVLGARDAAGHDVVPTAVYVDDERVAALDGRALAEDPGQHVIRFEHPPDPPVHEHVVLRVGERNREILATFPAPSSVPSTPASSTTQQRTPAPPSPPPRGERGRPMGWVFTMAGLGVLGIGAFAYFGLNGHAEKQNLLTSCAPACSDDQVSRVRFDYIAADTSLAVGVVALGVAGYLLFSSSSGASRVSVSPSRKGAAIEWTGQF